MVRRLVLVLAFSLGSTGCSNTGAPCPDNQRLVDGECTLSSPPCKGAIPKSIDVGCSLQPPVTSLLGLGRPFLRWELRVEPQRIQSGQEFSATFSGTAVVGADILNVGLAVLPTVGFRRIAVSNLRARVQVRRGATISEGGEPVLTASIDETCTYSADGRTDPEEAEFPRCSSENDNPDGSNPACSGLGGEPHPDNPCMPWLTFPTSNDCSDGGVCDRLAQEQVVVADSCIRGFCASGSAEIPLVRQSGRYLADDSGSVVFGWADDAPVVELGPNRGAFDLPDPSRQVGEEVKFSGFDSLSGGLALAWECVMGAGSRGDLGVETLESSPMSPLPDSFLISCPIEEPD